MQGGKEDIRSRNDVKADVRLQFDSIFDLVEDPLWIVACTGASTQVTADATAGDVNQALVCGSLSRQTETLTHSTL